MTDTSAYNGIRAKQVNQVNSAEGQAYTAYSTPDYFLTSESAFAPKRSGNNVRFFTTGDDYFKDVAAAIDEANEKIFITGYHASYISTQRWPAKWSTSVLRPCYSAE